ncbi:hypothetical protein BC940DRAFT_293061 [Gongronella butleri]|nr:hypothetical protein BC940DRAFT_293061 [Gongronella butleri]
MNILPHKSWNVYNKKNIEKVRRDEAKAKEEDDAKRQRALLADSESRLQLLRQRAEARNGGDESTSQSAVVRLFAEEEQAARMQPNEDAAKEKQELEKKQERQWTMYLGKDAEEKDAPWYARTDADRFTDSHMAKPFIPQRDSTANKDHRNTLKRHRPPITLEQDPLDLIKSTVRNMDTPSSTHSSRHKRHKKDKKEKKEKKDKHASPSIDELRAQRLERERAEKQRTRAVVFGDTPSTASRGYNSQYNREETRIAQTERHHQRRPHPYRRERY